MKQYIEAFIFDFGGVLTLPQDPDCLLNMAALCGVTVEVFKAGYKKERLALDRGDIDVGEYYEGILRHLGTGIEPGAIDGLLQKLLELDLYSWARENRMMTEYIHGLKEAGFSLGLLSNMPSYFLPKLKSLLPSLRLFDAEVFSCNVGLVKPEPGIYHRALDALNEAVKRSFKPRQVLFIDDMSINAEAAGHLGFNTIVYTDMQQFREEISARYTLSGINR